MPDENLPANQEPNSLTDMPEIGRELADRPFGSESITDNLPMSVYASVGGLANTLDPDQIAKLQEATPEDEVDIRPDDGAVYVSHEWVRRKMNDVFGFLAWTMVPATPLKNRNRDGKTEWFQKYVLFINGVYAAQAMASRVLVENNARISLDDVAEMIESNCLVRCCKKLGIALEPWNRRWRDEWRRQWAVEVVATNWKGQRVKMWRRKDADKLEGEIGLVSDVEKKTSSSAQPKADGAPTPQAQGQASAPPPPKAAAEQPNPTPPATPAAQGAPLQQPKPTGRGPTMSQAQVNMILAVARNAGLIVEQDPTLLMDLLDRHGVSLIESEGKTRMENCIATLRQILMKDVNGLRKQIMEQQGDLAAERI